MDHAEARELLDLAAVEPGGLDRLMAGDTPTAHALAGHLAGCDACTAEFNRLRQSADVIHGVISTLPPADLRDRTLALVAAVGRPRGPVVVAATDDRRSQAATPALPEPVPAPAAAAAGTVTWLPGPDPAPALVAATSGRRPAAIGSRSRWLAAVAALLIATAGVTGLAVNAATDASVRQASQDLEGLTEVALWTVRLDAQPDVRHVVLTAKQSVPGTAQVASLVFSPRTAELVVVADGLPQPPAGQEYRCWVEVAGARQRLGKMYVSGTLAYWVGDAAVLARLPADSVFGVSLADSAGAGGTSPAILSGTLGTS